MKFSRPDTDIEKRMLTGLIVSTGFVKRILPVFNYYYLDLPSVEWLAKEVFEYFEKYQKAPGIHIQDIFNDKKKKLKPERAEWLANFLVELNRRFGKEYEDSNDINIDYLFDQCVRYFKMQKLKKDNQKVSDFLDADKYDEAKRVWLDSCLIPEGGDLGIDPFDPSVVRRFFGKEKERASLDLGIRSLDRMVGPVKTGWLAIFMAPMKRGKTFFLIHMAIRAVIKGYNTVLISLETEAEDNAARFWMNVGSLSSGESEVVFPYFDGDKVRHETLERPVLDERNVKDAMRKFSRAVGNPKLRIKTYPMGTAGIEEFKTYLDDLEVHHFSPHVIVVDYLGIMKAPKGASGRDVYNENSIALKALGQERKAIVFSAHQGSRETLKKINMSPSDVPEDIRIFANVDVLYGLNQDDWEMDEGIMRVNVLGHRHRKFTRMRQAKVLYQFATGQSVLDDRLISTPIPKDIRKEGLKKDDN